MADSDFEKELRNRLAGLEAPVDDSAWDSIEKQLPPKNNPIPMLILLSVLLLLGIVGYLLWNNNQDIPEAGVAKEEMTNKNTRSPDIADDPAARSHAGSKKGTDPSSDQDRASHEVSVSGITDGPGETGTNSQIDEADNNDIINKAVKPDIAYDPSEDASTPVYAVMSQKDDGRKKVNENIVGSTMPQTSRIGLRSLTGLGAYSYPYPPDPDRLQFNVDEVEGNVLPPKVRNAGYIGMYLTTMAAYNRYTPFVGDDLILNRLESSGLTGRMALHAGISYQQYLSKRWSLFSSAGFMMSRYQFRY